MFCPNCRSEFRSGFTRCAHCGVDLVEHLSQDFSNDAGNVTTDSEGRQLLWSGMSHGLLARIEDALEAAKVEYVESETDFGLVPTTTQSVHFIWVAERELATAKSILDKVLAGAGDMEQEAEVGPSDSARMNPFGLGRTVFRPDPSDSPLLPEAPFESPSLFGSGGDADALEPDEDLPDDIVEDFFPEDATTEVWTGDDASMAGFLKSCLSGVGIGCVVDELEGEKFRVMVMPESENRAKKIVREVVDGEAPE